MEFNKYKDVSLTPKEEFIHIQKKELVDNENDENDENDKNDKNDKNDENDETNTDEPNTDETNFVDFNDEPGGIIYDILHFIDDIYIYGRTLLENNYINLSDTDDFNLVYPNIYIGNYSTSTNFDLLKTLGITHIISAIPTFNPPFEDKFKYLHIEVYDDESQDITKYFEISNEFIDACLSQGGKLLIHCMGGRSRSITLFLSFLIYIMQERFHKKSLNLENNNDIYNSIEYNKFIKDNIKKFNFDGVNNNNNNNNNNVINNNDYESINTNNNTMPQFNDKEKSFNLYKKEKMLSDVDELIDTYNKLKKEITIYKKNNDNNTSIDFDTTTYYKDVNELNQIVKKMKIEAGQHFIKELIKYITKYRRQARPNPYFIKQIIEYSFF
jgi:hypothetical protein